MPVSAFITLLLIDHPGSGVSRAMPDAYRSPTTRPRCDNAATVHHDNGSRVTRPVRVRFGKCTRDRGVEPASLLDITRFVGPLLCERRVDDDRNRRQASLRDCRWFESIEEHAATKARSKSRLPLDTERTGRHGLS
jgi:hypothetical protein